MTRQQLRVFLQGWFCGCGDPASAAKLLRDVLALHPLHSNRPAFEVLIPDDGMQYLLLYTLRHFDLTEHGGTVGGWWLTDKGKSVLEALEREAPDFDELTVTACVHGYAIDGDPPCEACADEGRYA